MPRTGCSTPELYSETIGGFFEQTVAEVYDDYERRLQAANAMDFDDMIMKTVGLLEAFPDVRRHWQRGFRYVMVDEYQDTNHAQFRLVSLLVGGHRNLAVVGDQDQSIYAFRGADIRNISEFDQDFPDAYVGPLEQNYRSTQTILDSANAVIAHNRGRAPKQLWSDLGSGDPVRVIEAEDEHAEARFVAGAIQDAMDGGMSAADVAVFYRMNAQSRVLEDLLTRQGVDYRVIGGPKFYDRAEIKDAVAYLQVIENPADEISLRRIVNQPRRGIGGTSLDRLSNHARAMGQSLWEAIEQVDASPLSGAAVASVTRFRDLIWGSASGRRRPRWPTCWRRCWPRAATRRCSRPTARSRPRAGWRTSRSWSASPASTSRGARRRGRAAGWPTSCRRSRSTPTPTAWPRSASQVTLMTLHNAKGLEFPVVFMIGLEEGFFPHQRSLDELNDEEERRLCYVGMTRARERLTLTHAAVADDLRRPLLQHAVALPGRAAAGRHRVGAPGAGVGRGLGGRIGDVTGRVPGPKVDVPALAVGDEVRHGTLGEGIVTGVDRDGIVVVRFRDDRSERRPGARLRAAREDLADPDGAVVVRRVPPAKPAGVHDLAGHRRVQEPAVAHEDADVAALVEEHQVAGPQLAPRHVTADLPLAVGDPRDRDAQPEVGVPDQP